MRVVPYGEFLERRAADACVVVDGELINAADLQPADVEGCTFKDGSGFVLYTQDDEFDAAEPVPAPRKKSQPMSTTAPVIEVIADAAPASGDLLSQIPLPITDGGIGSRISQPIASVMAAPADLRSAIPTASDTSGLTVIMAGIAVLGGGAAWKFYNDHSRRKHEQAMARIEREPSEDSHKKCDASRAALDLRVTDVQAKVDALNVRLDEIHRAIASLQNAPAPKVPEFDSSELEERLLKLEKLSKKGRK